jgi:uncharacterized repeat protein (TIGR01451 family)
MLQLAQIMVWGAIGAFCSTAFAQPAQVPAIAPAAPAQAASAKNANPSTPIQTQFKAYKVYFSKDGKEELESASSVSPGDVVEYVAQHRNVSQRRLLNVDFAIPIPLGMTLWQGSVQPAHGKLVNAQGTGAQDKDRAKVVWRVDRLDPGQSVELKLRVSIDPDSTLAPAKPMNPFEPRVPPFRRP